MTRQPEQDAPRAAQTPPPALHRHTWRATLYDGLWVEYCEALCGVAHRRARLRPNGTPVALPRERAR